MQPLQDKIPIGIITGFLGAGKTTLLNNLIREYPGKRFAIIENEFGEIGLDSELVLNIDNSNIYELANGCICCSLNEDLAGLVKDLLQTDRVGSFTLDPEALDPRPDHSITSYSFRFPGDFDLERLSYWIEYFLYINQANIFRIKGILSFADNPQKMIFQTVRSSYLLEDWEFWEVGEERINRLIFIRKEIPDAEILEALESFMH